MLASCASMPMSDCEPFRAMCVDNIPEAPSRAMPGVHICVTCEDERDTPLLTVFSRHFSKAS